MSRKYIDLTGKKFLTNQGYEAEVIECISATNNTIKLNDNRGTILTKISHERLKSGTIKNPYHRSVFGIGYLGEGIFKTKINKKMTKTYYLWVDVLRRSYRSNLIGKNPTYKDVIVCKEWHNFQNFAQWFEKNYNSEIMQGWHIDKDILIKGNKVYSPETCCFVHRDINNLFIKTDKLRGDSPIGVNFNKSKNKFEANISKNSHKEYLGTFDTPEEAFYAYKTAKEKWIKEVADIWKPLIDERVYNAMYNWIVEITD